MKVFPMRWEKIAAAVPGKTKAACAKSGGVEEGLSECQGCYRSIRSWMKQRESQPRHLTQAKTYSRHLGNNSLLKSSIGLGTWGLVSTQPKYLAKPRIWHNYLVAEDRSRQDSTGEPFKGIQRVKVRQQFTCQTHSSAAKHPPKGRCRKEPQTVPHRRLRPQRLTLAYKACTNSSEKCKTQTQGFGLPTRDLRIARNMYTIGWVLVPSSLLSVARSRWWLGVVAWLDSFTSLCNSARSMGWLCGGVIWFAATGSVMDLTLIWERMWCGFRHEDNNRTWRTVVRHIRRDGEGKTWSAAVVVSTSWIRVSGWA
ncbi:hypothetical protein ACLB2K_047796 [Fragaria x ananassa]